ncbi:ABC transporter ATP-binding protein [Candidatus Dojkabacteria bacterium]|nr:ABC transporter ATP-binding protein [Candidatus Dojkabacteria bacterium]
MKNSKYSRANIKKFFVNAAWTYRQVFSLAPLDMSLILITILVIAFLPTVSAFIAAKTVDETIRLVTGGVSFTELNWDSPIILLTLAMSTVLVINSMIKSYRNFLDSKFKELHLQRYTDRLYAKISSLDVQSFEDKNVSNSIQKAKDNLWKVRDFVLTSFSLLSETVGMVISSVIVLQLSPMLFIILTLITLPGSVFFIQFIREWWDFYDGHTEEFRTRWWIFGNITHEENAQENKVSNADTVLTKIVDKLGDSVYNENVNIRGRWLNKELSTGILNFAQNFLTPIYLIARLLKGDFTIGELSFYMNRTGDYTNRLDSVLGLIVDIFDSSIGVEHVKDIMERKNTVVSGNRQVKGNKPPIIEFKNVSFKYPGSKRYSLKNVSLKIVPGEEIAIVGENGAGKTTFIKLLLRFYDPTSGEILIDGIPLKTLDLKSYYRSIGVLFQEYNTYNFLTIEENISIGRENKKNGMTIEKALRLGDAFKFVSKLDLKTKHRMSKQFKDGVNLSSGQQQKIALARMFYRDAPVLILDEPTASIDAVAEHKIFERIYKFMSNKTVIIISHRFSTVRNAQKVYVFHKGEVVESGSHQELISLKGKYHKSFTLQAKGYN